LFNRITVSLEELVQKNLTGNDVASWASPAAAAAVAYAIYHATGKCIRDFPITPDKLMA
jgi:hypothetical protein